MIEVHTREDFARVGAKPAGVRQSRWVSERANDPPELSDLNKFAGPLRVSAIGGLAGSAADGSLDTEAVEATVGQLRQINLDLARIRRSLCRGVFGCRATPRVGGVDGREELSGARCGA